MAELIPIPTGHHPSNKDKTARVVLDDSARRLWVLSVVGGFMAGSWGDGLSLPGLFQSKDEAYAAAVRVFRPSA